MNKDEAKSKAKRIYEEVQGGVNEVIAKIREFIKEGSARRLIIKNKEGEVVFQTQLAFGVGGAALVGAMAPVISAIGMFAMFINDYQILVEREVDEEDEFSVDAEVIEITEDDEEEASEETKDEDKTEEKEAEEKEEKTVGKKKKK
ncbi:MAG: DUF4342 domain-containing protein [Balneolaceae bacterium]|nr:DUF4342 domain-containing protein [Balneolaceae bacterium]MBO6545064.1 DUF4342 domain-containing protein [Balneolaceae bacterium]MBO6646460.1 DUF4342 domain-containing protein [Balneolaceae bacterium]